MVTLRGRLGRDSLQLAVVHLDRGEQRLAWLEAFVRRHRPVHGRAGIVYTLTVDDTERVASFLASRGLAAAAYSSAVPTEDRQRVEDDLLANRVDVVVATSALGMGYDKPDLAFVVHLGAPSSPVSWYQQVGRAGRAIETAEVVLLPTGKDEAIWRHFDLAGIPTEREVDELLGALDADEPRSVPQLERAVNVRRSRLDLLLKVLDVDGAVVKEGSGWLRTGTPWHYDAERYRALADLRRAEHATMRAFVQGTASGCLMQALAGSLDDEGTGPCGRCQGCTGWTPDVELDDASVAAAREHLRTRDVVLRPRRQWPSGLDEVRGRIAAGRGPLEGRALAGDDGSGWGEVVDRLLASVDDGDGVDEAALDEVLDGLVEVLRRWAWRARPTAIVPVPSGRYGALAHDGRRPAGRDRAPAGARRAGARGRAVTGDDGELAPQGRQRPAAAGRRRRRRHGPAPGSGAAPRRRHRQRLDAGRRRPPADRGRRTRRAAPGAVLGAVTRGGGRDHLRRRACRAMPAAIDTLSESTSGAMGIRARTSAAAMAASESPGPSAPSTRARGRSVATSSTVGADGSGVRATVVSPAPRSRS